MQAESNSRKQDRKQQSPAEAQQPAAATSDCWCRAAQAAAGLLHGLQQHSLYQPTQDRDGRHRRLLAELCGAAMQAAAMQPGGARTLSSGACGMGCCACAAWVFEGVNGSSMEYISSERTGMTGTHNCWRSCAGMDGSCMAYTSSHGSGMAGTHNCWWRWAAPPCRRQQRRQEEAHACTSRASCVRAQRCGAVRACQAGHACVQHTG